jgi:hypothetical protein
LAAQHVARVTNALQENSGGGWDGHSQLTIYWLVDSGDLARSKIGHFALQVCFHLDYIGLTKDLYPIGSFISYIIFGFKGTP